MSNPSERPDWLTPDPWEAEEDRYKTPARKRGQAIRRYYALRHTPEFKAKRAAYYARADVKEQRREYHRAYYQRTRAAASAARWENSIGALHNLNCDGSHGRRGNRYCQPIPVYR